MILTSPPRVVDGVPEHREIFWERFRTLDGDLVLRSAFGDLAPTGLTWYGGFSQAAYH